MNNNITILLCLTIFISCTSQQKMDVELEIKTAVFKTADYELIKPTRDSKAVLILFGGFGEKPADIKREFKIVDIAKKNQISLILMNYSNKLWLEEVEKRKVATLLQETIVKYNLKDTPIFMGGFSSGGIVSMHISNYIIGKKEFYIDPKGVFIADSPIDLLALYKASKINIEKRFSEVAVQESSWIIDLFEKKLGNPKESISNFEKYAVYTMQSDDTKNLHNLKNTKIRLYTEPDTTWWKENRKADYKQMNAYYIKSLAASLKKLNFKDISYIPTENKGYRSNGERHPHSWSIIDTEDLINWMLDK